MNKNEIKIPVKGGYIVAERNSAPDYDGPHIIIETSDGDIVDLAVVEYKKYDDDVTTED